MFRAALISVAVLVTTIAPAIAAPAMPDKVVNTKEGTVSGSVDDGVLSWKGIPFAQPPVGALRWRAPQPLKPWKGVLETTSYAHDCMQLPFPSDAAPLGTPPSEDCLYLNVWRPDTAANKLPVLVWIYGGGFVNGGASPPTYSGAEMAKQGIVFVSFNYRLGRFGAFAHPALTKANADDGLLANYGYMDQIAALKWVQRNVASFGGDPSQVTIVGESAGAGSVHALVTSPLTAGLFNKAVIMSGGNGGGLNAVDLPAAEKIGLAFAQSKGITGDDAEALAKLRALPAEQVVDGLNMMGLMNQSNGPRTYSGPVVDGKISVSGQTAYHSGAFKKIPMMIGATSGDMGGKTGMMIAGAREIEGVLASQGVPVYAYRFSYIAEKAPVRSFVLGPTSGAMHASDIPYFFDTQAIRYGDLTTARDNQMGKTISTYVANFVKTGNPNGPGLANWPAYSSTDDVIMDFTTDGTAVAGKDPWTEEANKTASAQ